VFDYCSNNAEKNTGPTTLANQGAISPWTGIGRRSVKWCQVFPPDREIFIRQGSDLESSDELKTTRRVVLQSSLYGLTLELSDCAGGNPPGSLGINKLDFSGSLDSNSVQVYISFPNVP